MTNLKVEVEFTEEVLGTSPASPDILSKFFGDKVADPKKLQEEMEALYSAEEEIAEHTTIFPRDKDGRRFVYDYQFRGLFKDACGMLSRLVIKDTEGGKTTKKKSLTESGKITAYKKVIDGLIFVTPRKIYVEMPEGTDVELCQRPLRCQTAQGERVALASSEALPVGSKMTFTVSCLDDSHVPAVKEWLSYGVLRGFGQWRNSGKGRFVYRILEETHIDGLSFEAANGAVSAS